MYVEFTSDAGPPADPTPLRNRTNTAPAAVVGFAVRVRDNGDPADLARRVAAALRSHGLAVEGVEPQ